MILVLFLTITIKASMVFGSQAWLYHRLEIPTFSYPQRKGQQKEIIPASKRAHCFTGRLGRGLPLTLLTVGSAAAWPHIETKITFIR